MVSEPIPSSTAHALLTTAATAPNHIVTLPERLPLAAQRSVVRSMLKAGYLAEVTAEDDQPAWRTAASGDRLALRATNAGLAAVGAETGDAAQESPTRLWQGHPPAGESTAAMSARPNAVAAGPRGPTRLREAAQAVVTEWSEDLAVSPALLVALQALRTALTGTGRNTAKGAAAVPRSGSKREAVLKLLRRPEGATVAQVAEVTGWAQHTVRGFFAGLKRNGIIVTVLERVRQVGSGGQGAKGSYTVYRIEEFG